VRVSQRRAPVAAAMRAVVAPGHPVGMGARTRRAAPRAALQAMRVTNLTSIPAVRTLPPCQERSSVTHSRSRPAAVRGSRVSRASSIPSATAVTSSVSTCCAVQPASVCKGPSAAPPTIAPTASCVWLVRVPVNCACACARSTGPGRARPATFAVRPMRSASGCVREARRSAAAGGGGELGWVRTHGGVGAAPRGRCGG
jgi:hypothetical protein